MSTESMSMESKNIGVRVNSEIKDSFASFCKGTGVGQQAALEEAIAMYLRDKAAKAFPGNKADIDTFNQCLNVLSEKYVMAVKSKEELACVAAEDKRISIAESEKTCVTLRTQNEELKKNADDLKKQLAEQQRIMNVVSREKENAIVQRKNADETIAILNEKIRSFEGYKERSETANQKIIDLQQKLDKVNVESREMSKNFFVLSQKYLSTADNKDHEIENLKTRLEILREQLLNAKMTPAIDER